MRTFTSRAKHNLPQFLTGTTGLLVVLVCWHHFSSQFHPLLLPSPGETWWALEQLVETGELQVNLMITLGRCCRGYSAALGAALLLSLLIKGSPLWRALLRPLITVAQIVPPIIWIVLAVIWFGVADDATPIFLIFIVTFPITLVSLLGALEAMDGDLVEMARFYRCSTRKILFQVYLPQLFSQLLATISVGLSFAWKSTIFAEFLGSTSGVGYALSWANSNLETEKLFAWALVLIVMMLGCEYGLLQPLQRRMERWKV